MASTSSTSKDASLPASPSYFGSLLAKIYGAKGSLKLFSPGPYDSLQREVKSEFHLFIYLNILKWQIIGLNDG
jgi:hypothetical protein